MNPSGQQIVDTSPSEFRRLGRVEAACTVALSGCIVMVLEILGTRIIGPVFGVSLFVWAALLSVTLAALAIGYYAGGVKVDRAPSARLLGGVILVAGTLIASVPLLTRTVRGVVSELGLRAGPLVGALVLFGPSLAVLGMVGPVVVRLVTTDVRAAGHSVGYIYALSTAGSLLGTLLTAFVLIPRYETNTILFGGSFLLVAWGTGLLAQRGGKRAAVVLLLPIAASLAVRPGALPQGVKVLESGHNAYGLVEALELPERGVRVLRAEHSLIGAQFLGDRSPAFTFVHLLEALRFLRPNARDMLTIGLGIGSLPASLARFGVQSDVVEIDPLVVSFAEKHFGFLRTGAVFVEDARAFIQVPTARYDLVVHDTFTGGATPDHLLSLEVLQDIRRALRPNGVLALNFVGYQRGPHVEASLLVARTARAAFRHVRVFRDRPLDVKADAAVNLVFFASDAPLEFDVPAGARQFHNDECERIARSFQDWELFEETPPGEVITDARNPIATLQLASAEEHFEAMKSLLPREVWIH